MKSRVHKSKSPVSLKHAVKQWWGKSLTSSLYPDVKCWQKDCDVGMQTLCSNLDMFERWLNPYDTLLWWELTNAWGEV